jgi:hypothetical protein
VKDPGEKFCTRELDTTKGPSRASSISKGCSCSTSPASLKSSPSYDEEDEEVEEEEEEKDAGTN